MNTKRLFAFGTGIIIIALAAYGISYLGKKHQASNSETPTPLSSTTATPAITPMASGKPGKIELPPGTLTADYYKQFTKPATCQIEGSVKFISPTTAADSAKITYTGIDSPARQVTWVISPAEPTMHIGPNIDAGLKLPDGSQQVIVVLPKEPVSKTYTLTAKMSYGRLVGESIKVSEATCTGTINVERNY